MVALLERFQENPLQTRKDVRMELRWFEEAAAEVFALVVFLSDDLLEVRAGAEFSHPAIARSLAVVQKLPMELQMMLCHLMVGSAKESIQTNDSETAFRALATKYWLA